MPPRKNPSSIGIPGDVQFCGKKNQRFCGESAAISMRSPARTPERSAGEPGATCAITPSPFAIVPKTPIGHCSLNRSAAPLTRMKSDNARTRNVLPPERLKAAPECIFIGSYEYFACPLSPNSTSGSFTPDWLKQVTVACKEVDGTETSLTTT